MSDNIGENGCNDALLVGISLASEAYIQNPTHDVTLGVIPISDVISTIDDLRRAICLQLHTLPVSYTFLTIEGWPINKNQENQIKLKQILRENNLIRIHRSFEKPRVGVKTTDGRALGFVFIDYSCSITDLRSAIQQQIGFAHNSSSDIYHFVDRNGWPLVQHQESSLSVTDILLNATVVIKPFTILSLSDHESLDLDVYSTQALDDVDSSIQKPSKRPRLGMKQLTYNSSKDQDRQISVDEKVTFQPKQILISYVRSEAAQHAVDLKVKLVELGCTSVFLDVHEIKSGVDWADSLNYAVSNCEVFVPLVTSKYGETQWTNREVKLADMLSKFIVPVSFLDYWPPKCLAIQFATTQFIPWSSSAIIKMDDMGDSEPDKLDEVATWSPDQLSDITSKILDRVKAHQGGEVVSPNLSRTVHVSKLRSCPTNLPQEFSLLSQPRDGRPLVVISLHPQQAKFGRELKKYFVAQEYEVWCSTDLSAEVSIDEELKDSTGSDEELFSQEDRNGSGSTVKLTESESEKTDPTKRDLRKRFQQKIDEAGVVVFVLSKAYARSKTCRMQVFYCEHRKRVISLKYDDFCMPSWMSVLIGTGIFEDVTHADYQENLLKRVQAALCSNSCLDLADDEQSVNTQVNELRKLMPKSTYVYISGGTKFYHKQSKEICRAIGLHLASMDDITMVTGGFYGVGKEISSSYYAGRTKLDQQSNLWHVLPHKDDKTFSNQANQREDGSFEALEEGSTVFSGHSVRERETIVSRVFDICLLIEGGPGAAHEAEQFSWEGHTVIPVKVTGGAASGKFNVPDKIFQVPVGVCSRDWSMLSNKKASATEIAKCVSKIVYRLKERLKMDSPTYLLKKIPSFSRQQTRVFENTPSCSGLLLSNSPRKRKKDPENMS